MPIPPPLACPVCAALLLPGATSTHVDWHAHTRTLDGWTKRDVARFLIDNAAAVAALAEDDRPTQKFPPLRETILRRPPPPEVRELTGPELLRALAEELAAYEAEGDDEQQGDQR